MARTKETGPGKPTKRPKIAEGANTNGATKREVASKHATKSAPSASRSPETQSPSTKPPSQPAELSAEDKEAVKKWLDNPATDFKIVTAPLSRKRKRSGNMQVQTDVFEERLNVQYEVKPRDKWECLRRYKKFTVGSESITTGQCIMVKHDDAEETAVDYTQQWKAKVLEVRALDSEHVYIRVAWLNRPEDLKNGRKPYHGKFELVPTNQMDIIDAMAVNGWCNVQHWDENDDDSPSLPEDQYFWRQTFDYVGTKTFSDLRKICTDQTPVNPDEMILQCGSEACGKWQHLRCIAEKAAHDADDKQTIATKTPAKKKPKQNSTVTIRSNSLAQAKAVADTVTCEVMIEGLPNVEGMKPAESTYIQITDADGEKSSVGVQCLFCGTTID